MKNYTELLKGVNKMDTQYIMNMYEENSVYTLSEFVELFEEFNDEQQRIFCKLVDNLYFMSDKPKWAKDGEEYGGSEKRQLWYDGIKYLCETSEVLYIYR